jgi:hypothetical protein
LFGKLDDAARQFATADSRDARRAGLLIFECDGERRLAVAHEA